MFSIGEFSRLCMVTTKTLRHYDRIGLLKPAQQNSQTGYRYYDAAQLHEMLQILRLKEYGFSLEEIGRLLKAGKPLLAQAMRALLHEKQAQIEREGALLQRMQTDITQLEAGKDMVKVEMEVKIVERQPMDVLGVRDMIPITAFDSLFGKLFGKLNEEGLQPTGPLMALYYCEDFDPQNTDVEIAFPTSGKAGVTHTVIGGKYATALHLGAYGKLNETYAGIAKWVEQNGYKITGPTFEIYLNDPTNTAEADLKTEVYFPIG